jgi:hypothetical protein
MRIAAIGFMVLIAAVAPARAQDSERAVSAEQRDFTAVGAIGDPGYRSFFMFKTESGGYTIRADGYAESSSGKARPRNFSLPLGRNGHMVRFYFLEYEGDLLLVYEGSDGEFGWGYVLRLNQKTLKPKWAAPINGFNIGPAILEANCAYLSAANLFAKIDLQTGKYLWQQEDPQKQYALSFNGFRLPSIDGERILFLEDRSKGKTVELNKASGRILNVRE